MQYYKTLYFNKIKHSYELREINIHPNNIVDEVTYENNPITGFKICAYFVIDPISGYIFYPQNFTSFKNDIIKRNLVVNGVCTVPVIFDYLKNGSFNIVCYNDIKDKLETVDTHEKTSLSKTTIGTLIRNVDDEMFYIYLGSVGIYYVDINGKSSIKRKHAVFKINYLNNLDDNVTILVNKISYIDYKKDNDEIYFEVKKLNLNKLHIKPYYGSVSTIYLLDYISNNTFDFEAFSTKYPSFCITPKSRKLINETKLHKTKNKMYISSQKIGQCDLSLNISLKYSSVDKIAKTFKNAIYSYEVVSSLNLDFEKDNYAIDIDGTLYLIVIDGLNKIGFYQPSVILDRLKGSFRYSVLPKFNLYSLSDYGISWTKPKFGKNSLVSTIDFKKDYDLYKVSYKLNDQYEYTVATNDKIDFNEAFSMITDTKLFEELSNNHFTTISLLGDDYDYNI